MSSRPQPIKAIHGPMISLSTSSALANQNGRNGHTIASYWPMNTVDSLPAITNKNGHVDSMTSSLSNDSIDSLSCSQDHDENNSTLKFDVGSKFSNGNRSLLADEETASIASSLSSFHHHHLYKPISSPLFASSRRSSTSATDNYDENRVRNSSRASSADLFGSSFNDSYMLFRKERQTKELQTALEQSDGRRQILLDKLNDARMTIQLQSQYMNEMEKKNAKLVAKLDEMKRREKEFKQRTAQTNRQLQSLQITITENTATRNSLQEKIDRLESEVKSLTSSNDQLQIDTKRRQELVEQSNNALKMHLTDIEKLEEKNSQMTMQLDAVKELLELCRRQNNSLSNQLQNLTSELESSKLTCKKSSNENKEYSERFKSACNENEDLRQRLQQLLASLASTTEDRDRLQGRVMSLQSANGELEEALKSSAGEKERHFKDKLALHRQLQDAALQADVLRQEKNALEQQMMEMTRENERIRLLKLQEANAMSREADDLRQERDALEQHVMEMSKDKLMLHWQLQEAGQQTDAVRQQKDALEQQVMEMSRDAERTKRLADAERENNVRLSMELEAVKVNNRQCVDCSLQVSKIDSSTNTEPFDFENRDKVDGHLNGVGLQGHVTDDRQVEGSRDAEKQPSVGMSHDRKQRMMRRRRGLGLDGNDVNYNSNVTNVAKQPDSNSIAGSSLISSKQIAIKQLGADNASDWSRSDDGTNSRVSSSRPNDVTTDSSHLTDDAIKTLQPITTTLDSYVTPDVDVAANQKSTSTHQSRDYYPVTVTNPWRVSSDVNDEKPSLGRRYSSPLLKAYQN